MHNVYIYIYVYVYVDWFNMYLYMHIISYVYMYLYIHIDKWILATFLKDCGRIILIQLKKILASSLRWIKVALISSPPNMTQPPAPRIQC